MDCPYPSFKKFSRFLQFLFKKQLYYYLNQIPINFLCYIICKTLSNINNGKEIVSLAPNMCHNNAI